MIASILSYANGSSSSSLLSPWSYGCAYETCEREDKDAVEARTESLLKSLLGFCCVLMVRSAGCCSVGGAGRGGGARGGGIMGALLMELGGRSNEEARALRRRGERGGGRGIGGSRATVWSYRNATNLVSSLKPPSVGCFALLGRALLRLLDMPGTEGCDGGLANGAAIPVPPMPPCMTPNMILS